MPRPEGMENEREILMSDAWNQIAAEAEAMVEKSDGELSQEQAISKFLKTARGQDLYCEYRLQGDPLADLAEEELVVKSARIAKSYGLSGADALAEAARQYPDLASAAGVNRASVEAQAVQKNGGAWGEITRLASELVEKGDGTMDQTRAIDRVLSTPRGQSLYAEYCQERAGA